MAIFRLEGCKCGYKHTVSKPKTNKPCPKCGQTMHFLPNWYIAYTVHGKKYIKAVGPQKRMAEDALAKVKTEIREDRFFDKNLSVPWNEAVKTFMQWAETNLKPKSVQRYKDSLEKLAPFFEKETLNKITPQMVEEYKMFRSQEVTNSTVNRDIACLKRLFSKCVEWGYVDRNRVETVKLLQENPARKRFLDEEEIERLKQVLEQSESPYLRLAVLISLDTGLRKSNVLNLKWSEIDFNRDTITITEDKTKGKKDLIIPLTHRLKQTLLEHKTKQKILSPHILSSTGKPPVDLKQSFKTVLKKAGIKNFRWHDLRRTFGSHLAMKTKDLLVVQELLGHSDYRTTKNHYIHLLEKHTKDAMQKYETG